MTIAIASLCVAMVFSLCPIGFGAAILAQSSNEAEKLAILKALYVASGSENLVQTLLPQMVSKLEARFNTMAAHAYQRESKLSPEEAQKQANEETERVFDRFRQLLPKAVDLKHDIELIAVMTYDKHFSLDEANLLLSFYESPLGRKAVEWARTQLLDSNKCVAEIQPWLLKLAAEASTGEPAGAFSPADHSTELKVVPFERQALIRRLLDESGSRKANSESFNISFMQSMKDNELRTEANPNLTPEQRAAAIAIFRKVGPLMATRIDFGRIVEPYLILSMNSQFTDADLKELMEFYQNPTAKRAFAALPALQQEAMQSANALLDPKLAKVLQQAIDETLPGGKFKPTGQ